MKNNIDLNKNKYTSNQDGTVTFYEDAEQWTPIGTYEHPFTGIFDGNGYKISGLYIDNTSFDYQGLFGCLGDNSTIQKLTISGKITAKAYIGGIAGRCKGKNSKIIECTNEIEINGDNRIGGIIGHIANENLVTNCNNKGKIEGKDGYIGGITGVLYGNIKHCFNYAEIIGNHRIGGIVGYNTASANVSECKNSGTINGITQYIGGIAPINYGTINNCFNIGNINGGAVIGGIAGTQRGIITNCYNSAEIEGESYVGGIAGGIAADYIVKVQNCYSYGKITAINNNSYGAIIGANYNASCEISNCYYLTGTATGGINGVDVKGQAEEKTASFMQSSNFVDLLGKSNWKLVKDKNSNYPVLSWENGTAITNYTYAQDGLILWYDAIDNLGTGTHSSTTNKWKDLSLTGNDGALVDFKNDATSGWTTEDLINGLKLSGQGEGVLINKIDLDEITMEVVVKHDEHKNTSTESYIISNVEGGGYGIAWHPSALQHGTYVYSDGYKGKRFSAIIGKKYYIASRAKDGKVILNSNDDVAEATLPSEIVTTKNDTYLVLGGNPSGTNINGVYEGTIYSVRVYNRGLTDEEIQNNYQIDKARFGI